MKISDILREAPIKDIQHVGNFDRSSSFRHERDRRIVTHPASIENIKQKFGKTKQNFNLIFVNTPKGNDVTEYGLVSYGIPEVEYMLGEEVAKKTEQIHGSNDITVIFTNNKGAQRFHMTPWIIAHRMMHSFARKAYIGSQDSYTIPANELMRHFNYIAQLYGARRYDEREARYDTMYSRDFQIFMKNFFQEVGTFKSARDKKIRDWFEVFNELGAQYIITGDITFKELPRCIKANRRNYCAQGDVEYSEAEAALDAISLYYKTNLQRMLDSYEGKIFIM